jgi:integrase
MKTKFYLRKGTQKSTINFEYRNGIDIKFRASTGFVLNNDCDWDSSKQKMKLPSSTVNANLINLKLSEFQTMLNDLIYREGDKFVKQDSVKILFYDVFGITSSPIPKDKTHNKMFQTKPNDIEENKSDFITYYEWFLDFYSKNNSPYSKRILTDGTLKTFRNSLSLIRKYQENRKLKTIYFDDINRVFYNDFMSYLNEMNYSKNYLGTVIQKIKTIMGYSFDEGKHTNQEYRKGYFSKVSEVVNHPYLNLDELNRIEDLNLPDKEMDVARDIFLIGCYTGLRIGDLLKFIQNPNFVERDKIKFIQLKQSKTSKIVFIPLNSNVLKIMEKYDGRLPDYLHHNAINFNLKSIAKRAKINEIYQYTRTEGGKEVIHKEPKYKFISTHTARRSFCTNAYNEGMPVYDIMSISGHKTERVFLDYIKVDLLQNASRIASHNFFK